MRIGKFQINILKEIKPSVASVFAAVVSYIENENILWMLLHYFCGLFYLIYWIIKKIIFWIL